MDVEKLIERLRTESLYADKASLEIMDLCMDAATALSTLQAENEKLRAEVESLKKEHCAGCSVPVVEAERLRDLNEAPKLRAELEEVKRVLAMMWYAYENKDGEAPHEYEIEARRDADKVLGPWAECMPKYLRNSQESNLCDTCAHPFDEVCKGCSDGNRYEPKAPEEPVRIMDEITEFTRDQWDWLLGRFTRKED